MKVLSRILTICLCSAPLFGAFADGPVASTSGSNLTAYNPSTAFNNQWATMSNGRVDSAPNAKDNFGNCNALIMRCAQPKCANGGCTDIMLAASIVNGCLQTNEACKKYGDDLANSLAAQLVANSNAKVNAQNAALEQAKIQAEAVANAQSQQQMAEMQNQMYQMQQQIAQQQAESAAQIQAALAQQQAQSQQALDDMRAAATAAAVQNESGVSAYEEGAIARGASADLLERKKMTGQIITEIENAELKLKTVKESMTAAFDYAGCDRRGNNCTGPKRVKKFRELASNFNEPYEDVVNKIYDALSLSMDLGVDVSDVMMMLENSCQRWGQFMCPAGSVEYTTTTKGEKGRPVSCPVIQYEKDANNKLVSVSSNPAAALYETCLNQCQEQITDTKTTKLRDRTNEERISCENGCKTSRCKPCTQLKILSDKEEVYAGWVEADYSDTKNNTTVIACADNAITTNGLLGIVAKRRNGAGLVSLDALGNWLSQTEPNKLDGDNGKNYCAVDDSDKTILEKSAAGKSIDKGHALCVSKQGTTEQSGEDENCPYINPIYGLCDIHAYNIGKVNNDLESTTREEMKEVIGLKTTVLSQQLFKQYEYLSATIRRLKTMLERSVYRDAYKAAGASSEDSSSSGGLVGGKNEDKAIHLAGAENCANKMSSDSAYSCIQTNISLIISSAGSNTKKACKQLEESINAANAWHDGLINTATSTITTPNTSKCAGFPSACNKSTIVGCAQELNVKIASKKEEKASKQQFRGGWGYI